MRADYTLFQPRLRQQREHNENEKDIYVKKVSAFKLLQNYKGDASKIVLRCEFYYVSCNPAGQVDWNKTTVYNADALVGKKNINVIKDT